MQQNNFQILPLSSPITLPLSLSFQLSILSAYNNAIQKEQMVYLSTLYSLCNSNHSCNNSDRRQKDSEEPLDIIGTSGFQEEKANSFIGNDCNQNKSKLLVNERAELSSGNYNIDINETMPITPIKKQKKNNFFIEKKRNREPKVGVNLCEDKKQVETVSVKKKTIERKKGCRMIGDFFSGFMGKKEKDKTINHVDYEKTKSMSDFMRYNFNYDNGDYKTLSMSMDENINSNFNVNTALISSDDYGLKRIKEMDKIDESLPKKIWTCNDIGINDKKLKMLLNTFESKWPKKFSFEEDQALKIFALNNYNSELTARYFASDSFKNLLTYTAIQTKYFNSTRNK